ncbi:DUF3540 domain-containing protein [Pusillimonas sp. DMV24BSW_D]|uniref:DUF3540 domain-containing protein n=1 Tax=Neopusillimonas aestuarii TaxID=2716226 RepID=UPI00140A4CFF|nr:DUF3540 domain-containing protein [Pusillimonas sp. DMV24BSW_D]QIM48535.1 DUF3540 domain-containing protein [Pusillimonas sp. DMV24BSW_D]
MSATVHRLQPTPESSAHSLGTATVTGISGEHFLLSHPEILKARLAASCLLTPEAGDTVLVSHATGHNTGFILAILQRNDPDSGSLNLPGGAQLHTNQAGVELQTQNLHLNSAFQLQLNSGTLDINALSSTIKVKHWQGWFDTVESCAVNASFTAKTFSSQVGRLIQRLKESFRRIDGLEETRAGRVRVSVDDHHHIEAGHITHTAKGFVKIDGKKIDLG